MKELKEWFNDDLYRSLASMITSVYPRFDDAGFYHSVTFNLNSLELKQRMKRTAEAFRVFLPSDYRTAVGVLSEIAPKIENGLVGMVVPEFVGMYGLEEYDFSMMALKELTQYSSSEFAVREFIRHDFHRTISIMTDWANDENPHVRRLASEGSRPRLPWSFRIPKLIQDPSPVRPILERLNSENHPYVRKSVANHLNDISKDNTRWMLDLVSSWDMADSNTAWIVKHASRTLIKEGHPDSFALFGFEKKPDVSIDDIKVDQPVITLGQPQTFSFSLSSNKKTEQKLRLDYVVHYVKNNGDKRPKVFKLKELTLKPGDVQTITKKHRFENFTTRKHYPGIHDIEIKANGFTLAKKSFELRV